MNQAEMKAGTALHEQHGRRVVVAGLMRIFAVILMLAGLVLLVSHCTAQVL